MDREKFLAEREWVRSQLANVADFWLKNGMDHVHGASTPAWTGRAKSSPPTRASGCRAAAAGPMPICAGFTA